MNGANKSFVVNKNSKSMWSDPENYLLELCTDTLFSSVYYIYEKIDCPMKTF